MLWIDVRKGEREKGDVAYRILLEADMHKKDWLRRCQCLLPRNKRRGPVMVLRFLLQETRPYQMEILHSFRSHGCQGFEVIPSLLQTYLEY